MQIRGSHWTAILNQRWGSKTDCHEMHAAIFFHICCVSSQPVKPHRCQMYRREAQAWSWGRVQSREKWVQWYHKEWKVSGFKLRIFSPSFPLQNKYLLLLKKTQAIHNVLWQKLASMEQRVFTELHTDHVAEAIRLRCCECLPGTSQGQSHWSLEKRNTCPLLLKVNNKLPEHPCDNRFAETIPLPNASRGIASWNALPPPSANAHGGCIQLELIACFVKHCHIPFASQLSSFGSLPWGDEEL